MTMSGTRAEDGEAEAVALLRQANRALVICGAIDLAGAVAAVELARAADAILATTNFGFMAPPRGLLTTSPSEARLRADVILVVDRVLHDRERAFIHHLNGGREARTIVVLTPHSEVLEGLPRGNLVSLAAFAPSGGNAISVLRALLAGRQTALEAADHERYSTILDVLRGARYGVALWSAADIDEVCIENVLGLVDDLSKTTRWSALALPSLDGGDVELLRASLHSTGLAPPLVFDAGQPTRLPSGADWDGIDLVLWVSGAATLAFDLGKPVRLIALAPADATIPPIALHLPIGRPGLDHDAVLHDVGSGALLHRAATAPTALPTAADRLRRLTEALAPASACGAAA